MDVNTPGLEAIAMEHGGVVCRRGDILHYLTSFAKLG